MEQPVEAVGGKEGAQEYPPVRTADAVNAPVPLHQPHRIPRQVEVDDVPALLQVHAFGQHVGRDHQIIKVGVPPRRRLHRHRREALQGLLPGYFA